MNNMTLMQSSVTLETDLLIVPLCEGDPLPRTLLDMDKALTGGIAFNLKREKFDGQKHQLLWITTNGSHSVAKVLLVGVGPRSSLTIPSLQEVGGKIASALTGHEKEKVIVDATCFEEENGAALFAFGMQLKAWRFNKYCKKPAPVLQSIQFLCDSPEVQQNSFSFYNYLCKAVLNAREMISEPANVLFPETFAGRCLELSKIGLDVEILNPEQLEELGMHALLAVGKGSVRSPRVVILQWKGGADQQPPIALVGKGVCYDSGGINIKTTHLLEMKWDKAGAGAVLGTLQAMALMKAPINVVGVIGLVENMPDGAAMKPGDIIQTLAGKTVEVVDTDNEGRLVLADCLWYAQERFFPEVVIDLGTLTLETIGVLAGEYGGIFCEDNLLAQTLITAGNVSGERLWALPMGEAFAKQIESSIADMKNMGRLGFGESAAAAEFLKCFMQPGVKWAHLDIAGVAWSQEECPLSGPGVTAYGVRLLTFWLMGMHSKKLALEHSMNQKAGLVDTA